MKHRGKLLIDGIGALMTICGMAGMSTAISDGQGSLFISVIVFAIGFGISLGGFLDKEED